MEPITSLLDAFIKLADRIINLEKTKREDKQQAFKEIVEPLFVQLQPVAENYIAIFRKAKQNLIENSDNDLSKILDEIRGLREEMQLTRSTVTTMAMQIHKMYKDSDISEFAGRIMEFFDVSITGESSFRATYSMGLVRRIEIVMAHRGEKKILNDYINYTLDILEEHWDRIGKSYARVKINSLTSPRLIKKSK
jgi:hypothetical protein